MKFYRKYLLFLLLAVSVIACKKKTIQLPLLQGLWIEKTLRLDSIEFDNSFSINQNKYSFYLKSRPYMDVS